MTRSIGIRAAALMAASLLLAGCGASNLSSYLADNIPHWMGGLPTNAPPRDGDARVAEYYRLQLAARDKADAERAQANEQEARFKAAESDFDRLTRAQTMQSARRQMPAQQAGQAVAETQPLDSFSMSANALY